MARLSRFGLFHDLEENCLAAKLASAVQEFFVLSVEQELLKDLECSDGLLSPAKMWGQLTQIGQIAVDTLVAQTTQKIENLTIHSTKDLDASLQSAENLFKQLDSVNASFSESE